MKPFDPKIKCPKCDFSQVQVTYMQKVEFLYSGDYLRRYTEYENPILKEHLRRQCFRCNFSWPENIINKNMETK